MNGETLELLCFQVGDRTFAVDIMAIREILRNQVVTEVPRAPCHVAGVLNLRGALVPVVDLHQAFFSRAAEPPAEDPKLVVVRAADRTAALLVDRVLEVVSVGVDELGPVPAGSGEGDSVLVAVFRRRFEEEEPVVVLLVRLGTLLRERLASPLGGAA